MVFKLIRTDAEDPHKIYLPFGNHLIGRGQFVSCDDVRISKKHGELQVTKDTVILKSLHQNLCFYKKNGTQAIVQLTEGCTVNLCNGDRFGLLPNTIWFELLKCVLPSDESPVSQITQPIQGTIMATKPPINDEEERIKLEKLLDSMLDSPKNDEEIKLEATSTAFDGVTNEDLKHNFCISSSASSSRTNGNQDESPSSSSLSCPVNSSERKRNHTPTSQITKKLKNESQNGDQQPGPSGNLAHGQGCKNSDANQRVPPVPVTPVGRERCIYGSNCYRENPVHKSQFAHPTDPDWGSGAQGVCPYGRACTRRDPRHWRDHVHPLGMQLSPSIPVDNTPGFHVIQRQGRTFYIQAYSVFSYEDRFELHSPGTQPPPMNAVINREGFPVVQRLDRTYFVRGAHTLKLYQDRFIVEDKHKNKYHYNYDFINQ